MAGFTRFCVYRRTLHRTFSDTGSAGTAELDGNITFSADIPAGARDACVDILSDDDGRRFSLPLDGGSVTVPARDLCGGDGLFFYKFVFSAPSGKYQICVGKDGISDTIVDFSDDFSFAYQLTVYRRRKTLPKKMYGGIMYQIFPDRFFRGGNEPCRADAVIDPDWMRGTPPYFRAGDKDFKNNVFFGGDLAGIEKKLDYLSSLGVTCLYLNPIFEAFSNHKYDTGCYDRIDGMFGGEEAFASLLSSAKKHGMEIILDGVFNHTGDDSVYFNRYGKYGEGGAYRDKNSPYYKWYNFYDYPKKYESWWGIDCLPRVRCDEPSYRGYLFGGDGVIRKRIREGVLGFRLDVADELTDDFIRELKQTALSEREDCCIIGEVWEDASTKTAYGVRRKYLRGEELDSVMNYPVRNAVTAYLRDGDAIGFLRTVTSIFDNYPPEVCACLMNMTGTHDTERLITALAGKSPEGMTQDEKAAEVLSAEEYRRGTELLTAAYFILSVLPGLPCIYYGDEIGMQGYGDPFCRRPFRWGEEDSDVLGFFRKVGKIRTENKDLFTGDFRIVYVDCDILCIERKTEGKYLCAVVNRSGDDYVFSSETVSLDAMTGVRGREHIIPKKSCRAVISYDNGGDYGVHKKI